MTTTLPARTKAGGHVSPYDAVAEDYDRLVRPRYEAIASVVVDRAVELLDLQEADVVELAAGTGALTQLLAPLAGCHVATDISEPMLRVAQRRLGAEAERVTWALADVEDNGLPTARADLVTSSLGPVQDSVRGLVEALRLLRPGGRLVACTWGDDYRELELMQRVRERLGLQSRTVSSARALRARLAEAGFTEVVVRDVRLPVVHPSVDSYVAYRRAFGRAPDLDPEGDSEVLRVLAECAEQYVDRDGRLLLDWHLLLFSARRSGQRVGVGPRTGLISMIGVPSTASSPDTTMPWSETSTISTS